MNSVYNLIVVSIIVSQSLLFIRMLTMNRIMIYVCCFFHLLCEIHLTVSCIVFSVPYYECDGFSLITDSVHYEKKNINFVCSPCLSQLFSCATPMIYPPSAFSLEIN